MQLVAVAAAKLVPTIRIVPEPLAQLGAGRNLLHPLIQGRVYLRHPARPQSVDKDAPAVLDVYGLVCSLQFDVGCWDRAHRPCTVEQAGNSVSPISVAAILCSKSSSVRRPSRSRPTTTLASSRPPSR